MNLLQVSSLRTLALQSLTKNFYGQDLAVQLPHAIKAIDSLANQVDKKDTVIVPLPGLYFKKCNKTSVLTCNSNFTIRINTATINELYSKVFHELCDVRIMVRQELLTQNKQYLAVDNGVFDILNYLALASGNFLDWNTKKAIIFYYENYNFNRYRYENLIDNLDRTVMIRENEDVWEDDNAIRVKNQLDPWYVCLSEIQKIQSST